MELKDRLALRPGKMLHAGRPETERAGWHCLGGGLIELVTHAKVKRTANDGDVLNLGVRMWRDLVSVRQAEPHREEAILGRIAFKDRKFGTGRK